MKQEREGAGTRRIERGSSKERRLNEKERKVRGEEGDRVGCEKESEERKG